MSLFRIPIDLTWTGASGSPGVNVWHGRGGDPIPDPADVEGLAEILLDFYTAINSIYNTDVAIKWAGEANGVGANTGEVYTGTPWTVNGSGGTDHLAPANNVLVSWRAATGGRNGRGRTFLGPLQDAISETNGTPDEGVRGDIQDAIDDLISASSGFGNGALGVYSRTEGVFRDFVSGTTQNYFAVLRSRRD